MEREGERGSEIVREGGRERGRQRERERERERPWNIFKPETVAPAETSCTI